MADRLAALTRSGVSPWLDQLSRDQLRSGGLVRLIEDQHVSGMTTNPSIFAKAIGDGSSYRAQLEALANRELNAEEALTQLTADDVRTACDLLRPV